MINDLLYGDGSAGDLFVDTSIDWSLAGAGAGAVQNLQFRNCTITTGGLLRVPSGTVIRCSGDFINEGQIQVYNWVPGASSPVRADAVSTVLGYTAVVPTTFFGGRPLISDMLQQLYNPGFQGFGNGARGAGGPDNDSGGGGGTLRITVAGTFLNEGRIIADGGDAAAPDGTEDTWAGSGGGGGGIIALTTQTGFLPGIGEVRARGGKGSSNGPGGNNHAGGGGGGGLIFITGPDTSNMFAGSIIVSGGIAGAQQNGLDNATNGGGGGAGAGAGGAGGVTASGVSVAAQDGSVGEVFVYEGVPFFR